VETLGVGQSEIEIARTADSTVVVLPPGLGDGVQAIKAGILEIADVFALNKADREGIDSLETEMKMTLEFLTQEWIPPICRTVATTGEGIPELLESINNHNQYLVANGKLELRRSSRHEFALKELLKTYLIKDLNQCVKEYKEFDKLFQEERSVRTRLQTGSTNYLLNTGDICVRKALRKLIILELLLKILKKKKTATGNCLELNPGEKR